MVIPLQSQENQNIAAKFRFWNNFIYIIFIVIVVGLSIALFFYKTHWLTFTTIASLLIVALTIVKTNEEIKLVRQQIIAAQRNQQDIKTALDQFNALVLNVDNKASSVFNLLSSGHRIPYPTYGESIESTASFRLLGLSSNYPIRPGGSLFNLRLGHYTAEKDILCKKFLSELLKDDNIICNDKIILLIDSGSTVFPIFKLLCDYYWAGYKIDALKKIEIFTNNIPGFNTLLLFGREGSDVTADMIYKCNVIPGTIEGKYSAILGEESISHLDFILKEIRDKEKDKKKVFVSVITGNYISIQDGVLWRGDYHGAMKDAYIKHSDYVFIISPLGKIFNKSVNEINDMIEKSPIHLTSHKQYRKLNDIGYEDSLKIFSDVNLQDSKISKLIPRDIAINKNNNVFLITSKRDPKDDSIYPTSLLKYFLRIHSNLEICFRGKNIIDVDFSPDIHSEQVIQELSIYKSQLNEVFFNYEFPHPEIRAYMKEELLRG